MKTHPDRRGLAIRLIGVVIGQTSITCYTQLFAGVITRFFHITMLASAVCRHLDIRMFSGAHDLKGAALNAMETFESMLNGGHPNSLGRTLEIGAII